eukprot:TRINITY_DN1593_c0_g2_i5.p2 TRINITY_DN1593_c0_g2~~TRINITY_DN1593_c0_g2_i5.p2  ORF type:complete len:129 (+),score=9.87 TRINITY_DN1593_c0_g2_i5:441-827(+)
MHSHRSLPTRTVPFSPLPYTYLLPICSLTNEPPPPPRPKLYYIYSCVHTIPNKKTKNKKQPHGSGVYTSYNSSIFEGKWQDGVRHGRAVLSIGPARWESTCKNGVMNSTKESRSVLVVPEMPCFHLHL